MILRVLITMMATLFDQLLRKITTFINDLNYSFHIFLFYMNIFIEYKAFGMPSRSCDPNHGRHTKNKLFILNFTFLI